MFCKTYNSPQHSYVPKKKLEFNQVLTPSTLNKKDDLPNYTIEQYIAETSNSHLEINKLPHEKISEALGKQLTQHRSTPLNTKEYIAKGNRFITRNDPTKKHNQIIFTNAIKNNLTGASNRADKH